MGGRGLAHWQNRVGVAFHFGAGVRYPTRLAGIMH